MTYDELVDYCKEAGQTISELDYKNRILEKENQTLKKKYVNAVSDYETTMFEKEQLKKQLEEYKKDIEDLDNQNQRAFENMQLNQLKVCNMIKQQKEFIKYLEDEIKRINPKDLDISELNLRLDDIKFTQYLIYKEILQKYKETIGDDK